MTLPGLELVTESHGSSLSNDFLSIITVIYDDAFLFITYLLLSLLKQLHL